MQASSESQAPRVLRPGRQYDGPVTEELISLDEVRHVARLARLELSPQEITTLRGELSALLDHVDKVRRLDTSDVEPTAHPLPLSNVLRPDEIRPGLERAEVLAEAPAIEDNRFLVPPILASSQ